MKKAKLIYNPFAGDKSFKFNIDVCVNIFQEYGYEIHLFRTKQQGDIQRHIAEMDENYDIVVVSGGDGTVNIALNAMMKRKLSIPLGIIPSGTANDFATFLGFKSGKIEECCNIIAGTQPHYIDVGVVNDTYYFINVCAGGLLANVSQTVDLDLKHALGSFSYYIKGVEQLPNFFKKIPFRITTSTEVIEEQFYLFLVLNSAGTGGFGNLVPTASVTDGKFDFIGIKAKPVIELPILLLKIMRGELVKDSGVVYIRDSQFKIECLKDDFQFSETTVDGEKGPEMPLEVKVIPQYMPVFGKFKNDIVSRET